MCQYDVNVHTPDAIVCIALYCRYSKSSNTYPKNQHRISDMNKT